MPEYRLSAPLADADVLPLRPGDRVYFNGTIYAARDAAHQRLVGLLERGEELPLDLAGQVIYYVGPSPAKPGHPIGSAGPTTSGRVDPYTPRLLAATGLKAMLGKGSRSAEVRRAMQEQRAVYLAAVGGAAALIARCIKECDVVAYPELGPEAIMRLRVEDLPAIVVNDCHGGDLYEEGVARYACSGRTGSAGP